MKVQYYKRGFNYGVCDCANSDLIAECPTEQDAAHIVLCVNSHEALVRALEDIRNGMADDVAYRERARAALSATRNDMKGG